MSFLYLEARKGILRRYTLIALALFLCLNTVKIIADYHAGEIRPVAANTSGMQAGYDTIYERIKGPITEEPVRFLTSEYQRLDALTADGTYSREPQEGTYSGYIFGDYYLLHSYFYPHMEYSVKYSSDMEEILAQAKENMTFYQAVTQRERQKMPIFSITMQAERFLRFICMTAGKLCCPMTFPIC